MGFSLSDGFKRLTSGGNPFKNLESVNDEKTQLLDQEFARLTDITEAL